MELHPLSLRLIHGFLRSARPARGSFSGFLTGRSLSGWFARQHGRRSDLRRGRRCRADRYGRLRTISLSELCRRRASGGDAVGTGRRLPRDCVFLGNRPSVIASVLVMSPSSLHSLLATGPPSWRASWLDSRSGGAIWGEVEDTQWHRGAGGGSTCSELEPHLGRVAGIIPAVVAHQSDRVGFSTRAGAATREPRATPWGVKMSPIRGAWTGPRLKASPARNKPCDTARPSGRFGNFDAGDTDDRAWQAKCSQT